MAGGDLHIRIGASHTGATHKVIDASSQSNQELGLTSPVTVGGRTVFVTEQAQARLQDFQNPAFGRFQLEVRDDTRVEGWFPWTKRTVDNLPQRNDSPERWPEEHLGARKVES